MTTLPWIERFTIAKRCVVVIPNLISGFGFSDADFRNEVAVHDYICEHRTGITLRGRQRRKEEKCNAAEKHLDRIALKNFFSPPTDSKSSGSDRIGACSRLRAARRGCGCGAAAEERQGLNVVNVDNLQVGERSYFFSPWRRNDGGGSGGNGSVKLRARRKDATSFTK